MAALNEGNGCKIWKGYQALCTFRAGKFAVENSLRAGGSYVIGPDESFRFANDIIDDSVKARLTTMLVNLRKQGVRFPEVTRDTIEAAKNTEPMSVHERADRLLRFISEFAKPLGTTYDLRQQNPGLYAWSESTEERELGHLLDYLIKKGWLEELPRVGQRYLGSYSIPDIVRLTTDGYVRIADVTTNTDSSQAFVAMWFNPTMNEVYDNAIAPAIGEAGYKPYRIDRDDYLGKVEDKIIAEIRRSRFLVADFTSDDGVRGGVYYEAVFAEGLSLRVIPMCKKGKVDNDPNYLHFDTSHLNHILWSDASDLKEQLKNRILAVFGQGPELASG